MKNVPANPAAQGRRDLVSRAHIPRLRFVFGADIFHVALVAADTPGPPFP